MASSSSADPSSVPSEKPLLSSQPPTDERPWWKRLLPFGVAAILTMLLVLRLDLTAFLTQIKQANYALFVVFCCGFVLCLLCADAFATSFVYRRTVCPIGVRELALVRGASYLPSLLNHHVGQAWLTWYMSRAYRAPLWRVAGATLLVYATTFASLFLFGALSLCFDHTQTSWLLPLLVVGGVSGIAYLIVIRIAPLSLAKHQVLAPLFEIGVKGHLQALAMRLPHMLVLFLGSWIPFAFFGVKIPPGAAFAYVPILMVIAALPISPQGVGTRDWFALHYFSQFATGETVQGREAAIAATTLSFVVGISLFQAILALTLMHRALRVLAKTHAGVEPHADGRAVK